MMVTSSLCSFPVMSVYTVNDGYFFCSVLTEVMYRHTLNGTYFSIIYHLI